MSTQYLLACPCGQKITVTSRQAGEMLHCECGHDLEVPTMRGLRDLERAGEDDDQRPLWTARQGLIFLGLTIMLAALAFTSYLYWHTPVLDESLARAEVQEYAPVQTWELWRQLRKDLGPEQSIWVHAMNRQIETFHRWITVGLTVAAAGLLTAIGAFVAGSGRISRQPRQVA